MSSRLPQVPANRQVMRSTGQTVLEGFEGIETENILIEGDDPVVEADIARTNKAQQRFEINNLTHARQTELILFEGGWLSIRHHSRTKAGEAQLINLRFVDPEPSISRYVARKTLLVVASLASIGTLCSTLAYFSVATDIMIAAAASSLLLAGAAFAIYVYRSQEQTVFRTRTGRAPVISLVATLGCLRRCREVVPKLTDAIKAAQDSNSTERQGRLRDEMREHYRLTESGALSREACAISTQNILAQFD